MCRFIFTALCLISAGVLEADAQTTNESAPLGREMETRVATVVAERWRVDPDRVVLQWGHVREGLNLGTETPFDVRGRTTGTNFTVVFSIKDRPPIALGLRVGLRSSSPLATRPLPNGHIVADGDVAWGDWVRWGNEVHDPAVEQLPIGWRVRTSIAAGELIGAPAASPPPAVRAGSTVEVIWRKRLVVVRILGVAMHDAAVGQYVRIRLEGGRGSIRGVVNANGLVKLSDN